MDLLKALFWTCLIIAALLAGSLLIAVFLPLIVFGVIVFLVWLYIKATKEPVNTDIYPDD